jgi:cytochrome d ubiquinol oxidase subunit II
VAVFIVATFAAHGAIGLAHRTEGPVHDRSRQIAALLWRLVLVLLVIITAQTWIVHSELFSGMMRQPFGWLGLICVAGGITAVFLGMRSHRDAHALAGSSIFIAGLVIAGAAGVFPFMLYSTLDPQYSLSAYDNAASGYGLAVALVWWPMALIFAVSYFLFIYRHYNGKVKLAQDTQVPY